MPTRHMIVANQNETVRKALAQEDIFLATIDLQLTFRSKIMNCQIKYYLLHLI